MRQGFSKQKPFLDLLLTIDAIRIARHTHPDILHAHVHEGLAVALVTRVFVRGSRVVYDAHGTLTDELVLAGLLPHGGRRYRLVRRIEKRLVRRADAVIAQSNHRAADLVRDGVDADRVVMLADAPEQALLDVGLARTWTDDREDLLAVYTGSLETYQGIGDIIDAAGLTSGIRFVLFGEPGAAYRDDVAAKGLSDRIEIIDPAPFSELPALLARADIALAPRHYGGNIPGKVPAYLAAGVPVIGTEVEGIIEIVDETVGAVVPPFDADALARALQDLANDRDGLRRRGMNAVARAQELYSEASMVDALKIAYGANH
jgi:glycosyltransferase involved in cell wall biosynthesis